jgi:hypothetical protein
LASTRSKNPVEMVRLRLVLIVVEVTSGPRNGMFINMTDNERRGQAFVLVKRDDHDLHIYGTGENRRVIVSWHRHQRDDAGKTDGGETGTTGGAAAEA